MAWIGTAGVIATLPMLWMSHARRDNTIASPLWLAAAATILIAASTALVILSAP